MSEHQECYVSTKVIAKVPMKGSLILAEKMMMVQDGKSHSRRL